MDYLGDLIITGFEILGLLLLVVAVGWALWHFGPQYGLAGAGVGSIAIAIFLAKFQSDSPAGDDA